jgi:hypothetical protein
MNSGEQDAVIIELKRVTQSLKLSHSQQEQLRTRLADKQAELQELRQQNPNIQRKGLIQKLTEIRSILRIEVVNFLTPQQLEKWDAEAAKAEEFFGHGTTA